MAETKTKGPTRTRTKKTSIPLRPSLSFHRKNLYLLGAALACILLGYILLAAGSEDMSSFLLVVGYLVLMPLAIVLK